MINIVIFVVSVIQWILVFILKPYCHVKSNFWAAFLITIFGLIGGMCGFFGCQSIIYLCGGRTFLI